MQQVNIDLKKFLDAPTSTEDQVENQSNVKSPFVFILSRRENEKI